MNATAPLRLTWLEATVGDPARAPLWSFLRRWLARRAGPGVETRLVHFPGNAGGVRHPATRLLTDAMALAAIEAAAPQADLVVLGCWGAPALTARALSSVPVTGLTEGSVRLGAALARRPAIVTVAEGLRATLEQDIDAMGLRGVLLDPPVWWLDPPSTPGDVDAALHDPEPLVARFDAVATRAADAGADAILNGCGYVGPILADAGYRHVHGRPDVPVYDCNELALTFGLALARLAGAGWKPSPRSFGPPPEAAHEALRGALGRLTARVGAPT